MGQRVANRWVPGNADGGCSPDIPRSAPSWSVRPDRSLNGDLSPALLRNRSELPQAV